MVASLSAAIVDDAFFAAQFREEPSGRWRKQERPVGRREDVRNGDFSHAAPKMQKVDGLPQNRTQAGDGFCPGEYAREWWIDGEETNFHVGIVLPEAHEQVGLDGLSANVAQAGGDDGDLEFVRPRIRWRAHLGDFLLHLFSRRVR